MPSIIARFSPEILHSYPLLQDYLLGKETDERVKNQVIEASQNPIAHNWMGTRRYVSLLINGIFKIILGLFAKAMSYLLYFIGLRTWSYKLDIRANIALRDDLGSYNRTFGEDFLVPAMNIYSSECIDLYLQPKILKRSLKDVNVRKLINSEATHLEFDRSWGMCRGESLWFIRHYFKTKDLFVNHQDHMRALGQLFSWGSPPEAALIQHLCPKEDFVELLEKGKVRFINWLRADEEKGKKIAEEFKNLPVGAYLICTSKHAMVYICAEKGQGYLFDPNPGTIAIHDQEGFEKLAEQLMNYEKKTDRTKFWLSIQQLESRHD